MCGGIFVSHRWGIFALWYRDRSYTCDHFDRLHYVVLFLVSETQNFFFSWNGILAGWVIVVMMI